MIAQVHTISHGAAMTTYAMDKRYAKPEEVANAVKDL